MFAFKKSLPTSKLSRKYTVLSFADSIVSVFISIYNLIWTVHTLEAVVNVILPLVIYPAVEYPLLKEHILLVEML